MQTYPRRIREDMRQTAQFRILQPASFRPAFFGTDDVKAGFSS
jgi:hypothetical protein